MAAVLPTATGDLRKGSQVAAFSSGKEELRHGGADLEDGYDMRTPQEPLWHNDILTTMIYAHMLNRGGKGYAARRMHCKSNGGNERGLDRSSSRLLNSISYTNPWYSWVYPQDRYDFNWDLD